MGGSIVSMFSILQSWQTLKIDKRVCIPARQIIVNDFDDEMQISQMFIVRPQAGGKLLRWLLQSRAKVTQMTPKSDSRVNKWDL